jgi:hypothetical protein
VHAGGERELAGLMHGQEPLLQKAWITGLRLVATRVAMYKAGSHTRPATPDHALSALLALC